MGDFAIFDSSESDHDYEAAPKGPASFIAPLLGEALVHAVEWGGRKRPLSDRPPFGSELAAAVIDALTEAGLAIVKVGEVPPWMEPARQALKLALGVALALDADHNVDEYGNGCRICSPAVGGWPCIVRMEVDGLLDALNAAAALTQEDDRG